MSSRTFGGGQEERSLLKAMRHGAAGHCPACGNGRLYRAYLKTVDECGSCGTELHHHRADDAPPYMTIFVVGHVVVAGALTLETHFHPPTWVHYAAWIPLLLVMSIWLLPRIKGALVGLQWALRMHGFDENEPQTAAVGTEQG